MLSATPVNNRLADLRNQIAFVTEGDDTPGRARHRQHRGHHPQGAKASSTAGLNWTRKKNARRAWSKCWASTTSPCWTT
jgi:hypothetical protein